MDISNKTPGSPEGAGNLPRTGARKCGFCEGWGSYSFIPLGRNGFTTVRCSDCNGTGLIAVPEADKQEGGQ